MAKKGKLNDDKKFNAYKYAQEFEKLSLEIVNIICEECYEDSDAICQDTTQATRDKGVDAYLILKVNKMNYTYTVEAKLRTADTLSLKDFATSILYYLINTSAHHFIVTNISYSNEALKYIEKLNQREHKTIELIDGTLLQQVINSHLMTFYKYSEELLNYIQNRVFSKSTSMLTLADKEYNIDGIVKLPCYKRTLNTALEYIDIGYSHFLVTGSHGTGKSTWLALIANKLSQDYAIHKIDIAKIQTPKLFLIEILRLLLGINIDSLFSELTSAGETIDSIVEEIPEIKAESVKVMNAVRMLIDENALPQEDYIYMLNLLFGHLSCNFLIHMHIVLIIENLHESNSNMISFAINAIRCVCCKNVIVFWELLTPQYSTQLHSITLEQWHGYTQLLKDLRFASKGTQVFSMKELEPNDVIYAINSVLPNIIFSQRFFDSFINYYGLKPESVFNALRIIKYKKAYSSNALKYLSINNSDWVIHQMYDLTHKSEDFAAFYQRAFAFTWLLNGNLKPFVIQHLNELFQLNASNLLLASNIYFFKEGMLFCQTQYFVCMEHSLDYAVQIDAAKWLLINQHYLDFNYIERKYYDSFFKSIMTPNIDINQLNKNIQWLYQQQAYEYVLQLAKIRYQYYKERNNRLLYYKYYVEFLSYIQKANWHNLNDYKQRLEQAEYLKFELSIQYGLEQKYIQTSLNLALIQYFIAKSEYNYALCKEQVEYILSYEGEIKNNEIFAIARIYYALIKKEQGNRKGLILELVNALTKYSDNKDVKVSYYVNLAAMYKFKKGDNFNTAIKLLEVVKGLTYNQQKGHGNLEVEINLLHLRCHRNEVELPQIYMIRFMTEKANSIDNLAKTFNLEAYYYLRHGEGAPAIECLQTAVYHCLSNGQSKQYFLFSLNLINALIDMERECMDEFYKVFHWFCKHQERILTRIKSNPYRKTDHMYSAVISLILIIKKLKLEQLISTTKVPLYFPNFNFKKIDVTVVHEYYVFSNNIFILF